MRLGRHGRDQLTNFPAPVTIVKERRPAGVTFHGGTAPNVERAHDAVLTALEDDPCQAVDLAHSRPVQQYHVHVGTPR